MEDLIPGLTNDVARECLARVPFHAFPTLFSVCKLWQQELRDPRFHRFRKSTGNAQAVAVLVQAVPRFTHSTRPQPLCYRPVIFELATGVWSSLPPCHSLPHGLPLICRLATVGTELVVVGGWKPPKWATTDEVHVYDFVSGRWRRGSPLPSPLRSYFACAATDDSDEGRRTVYIAGGHDDRKNGLRSALAYDVAGDSWKPLPDMACERIDCHGVTLRGKFLVLGLHCAEAFDAAAGSWGPVEKAAGEEYYYSKTYVAREDGRMYRCLGREVTLQLEGGVWAKVAELSDDMRRPRYAVACEGKLMVMGFGHDYDYAVNILDMKATTTMAAAAWKKVEVPPEYRGSVRGACCLVI
ncbi:hypothetical protein BHE74_00057632 [Ensete ventricosum]|nr:hypothetical protein BHE74_00057632 [Ensete ventricosum]